MGCTSSNSAKERPDREGSFRSRYDSEHGGAPLPPGADEAGLLYRDPSMAPVVRTPRTPGAGLPPTSTSQENGAAGDDELVLICVDCGSEILAPNAPPVCPRTGKRHV